MCKRDRRALKTLLVVFILLFIVHFSIPVTAYRVRDSVVAVHIEIDRRLAWRGSGVVIDDGIILTAKHIVENAEKAYIITDDGKKLHATRFIEADNTDLGLIIFDANDMPPKSRLSVFKPFVGQTVFGIGSRYGLSNSFFQGFVGAKNRLSWMFGSKFLIQLDIAGNPGDSGAGVFNRFGNVVGIIVGGRPQGITYIVPAKICRLFLNQYYADRAMENAK